MNNSVEPGGGWISGSMQAYPPRAERAVESTDIIVEFAVWELRAWGRGIDRETARQMLKYWRYRSEITDAEAERVAQHFPVLIP